MVYGSILEPDIATMKPESYIADGTVLTFVTRNAALFERVISGYLAMPNSDSLGFREELHFPPG